MLRDVTYSLRALRKAPGFAAAVVVSIALGVAANTTVFSMVNATLLGALPVRDPRGLYEFSGGRTITFPYADYRDFRDQTGGAFAGLAAHFPAAPASIAGQGTPERVWGELVSGNYFSVVGPPLTLGRGVTPEEDQVAGRSAVVVLSDSLWRRRFGADPNVPGKTTVLNGHRYAIIGVMSPRFHGVDRGLVPEFWAPLAMRADFAPDLSKDPESRTEHILVITGRLKPGVSRTQGVAAINVVDSRIHDAYRKNQRRKPLTLAEAGGVFGGGAMGVGGFMAMLMVVVGLVLLIACANVANLLLARAVERRREIGIRLALGAGRGRLIRQLLTESVVLASIGAAGGFFLAFAAARGLSSFQLPLPIPFAFDFTPDLRVLAFTAALAVAAGVLAGLAPAVMATRTDLVSALKNAGAGFGFFRRFGLRNLLVGLQVTLSAILLIAAGLFLRSLGNAASIDLGIRPENVLLMTVDPVTAAYSNDRLREFLRQLESRAGALPGVRSVAAANILPLSLAESDQEFQEVSGPAGKTTGANVYSVTARYFETIGIPVVRGRSFNSDTDLTKPVAIISRTMARRMFGDADPVGRMIATGDKKNAYEIVGVSGDSKSVTLGEELKACAYTYLPRKATEDVMSLLGMTILVKTSGDPAAMTHAMRDEIGKLDPNLAVFNMETMTQHVAKAFMVPRLCATLFGVFGLLGLALASVGLYGVVSYSVRSRTREIGIRMALGARPAAILGLISKLSLSIVGGGLLIGLGMAWSLSHVTASLLYGLSATDPVTFIAVPLVLLIVALTAVYVPARRAASIQPMTALRME